MIFFFQENIKLFLCAKVKVVIPILQSVEFENPKNPGNLEKGKIRENPDIPKNPGIPENPENSLNLGNPQNSKNRENPETQRIQRI